MNTSQPYDLVIGLDRSDKKADLCLIDTRTSQRRPQIIDTAPEALWEWLLELRQQHPQARVGLCLEQPAVHLIAFLESYDWITLHPINPITLQKYREAFVETAADKTAQTFKSVVACAPRATLAKLKSSAMTARKPSVPNLICDIR